MTERELFIAALRQPDADARAAFLDGVCVDEQMRSQVNSMLRDHEQLGSFLESPASPLAVMADADRALEGPGTIIGPYKLMEQIGEGGMGIVFVAEQAHPLRRRVALKVIKPGMDSRQVIARFEAERQALAIMDHPNIARVFDAGVTESGRPYFVMELVRGIPITDYCDAERLPIRERLELFVLVCHAVRHAHQKGVIHRDLKPSNILVTLHDGVPVPKVIDFGVAKATGQALTEKTIYTAFTQLIGTPLYMSPEQVEMSGLDVDTRSDIYSLGVLLYELLTGTTPFDSETLRLAAFDEMRRIIREDEPPNPSTRLSTLGATLTPTSARRSSDPRHLNRTVRGELDWITMKALEKDRTRRYETANDFAADVMRHLTDQPVEAFPPSAQYRFRKFARRNRAVLTTTALVAAALLIGTAVSAWQAVVARRAEREAVAAWAEEFRQRNRAVDAETLAKNREREAHEEAEKATRSEADTRAFGDFLAVDVLAVARPEGVQGGLGVNVTVARALEAAEANLNERFAGRPRAEATAHDAIGKTWRNLAKYEQAERHLRRAVELREQELGPNDPLTLDSCNSLGLLLGQMARYQEAIALLETTVERSRATLGPDDDATLVGMTNLAGAYESADRRELALPLFERIHERRMATFGPDDPETLRSMNNLATEYAFAGRHDRALPLLEQVFERLKATLGPDHPNVLVTMNNLACEYRDAGRLDKALPLFVRALDIQKKKLAPDHPDTLITMNNLAVAYRETGRLDEAEPPMREAVEGARRTLGPDYPQTQFYLGDLANLNWRRGRFAEAASNYEEVLRFSQEHRGDDDVETIKTAFNLAVNYRDAGRPADAERVIEAWLPRGRDTLGQDDPTTRWGIETAASIYEGRGQPTRAEPLYRELVKVSEAVDGVGSTNHAAQLAGLGLNLLMQRRYADAEPIVRECLAIREKSLPGNWRTFNAMSLVGGSLLGQEKYAEAEPLLLSGYEGMRRDEESIPAAARFRLTTALERVVQLYDDWGRKDKADEWRAKLPEVKSAKPAETKCD